MMYGNETWALSVEQTARFARTEMRMVCWMSGVSLKEYWSNEALRERIGIEPVSNILRRNRLRWLGHVLRKGDEDWLKQCFEL